MSQVKAKAKARPKLQAVPFQTTTRASAPTAQAIVVNIPIQTSSPTRPSRILARLSPVTMATNDDLIQALTAFTQAAGHDRAQQQQKHDAISEGWTDAHKLQVGIRRLLKTALLWHVQTGHMHGDWAT